MSILVTLQLANFKVNCVTVLKYITHIVTLVFKFMYYHRDLILELPACTAAGRQAKSAKIYTHTHKHLLRF